MVKNIPMNIRKQSEWYAKGQEYNLESDTPKITGSFAY